MKSSCFFVMKLPCFSARGRFKGFRVYASRFIFKRYVNDDSPAFPVIFLRGKVIVSAHRACSLAFANRLVDFRSRICFLWLRYVERRVPASRSRAGCSYDVVTRRYSLATGHYAFTTLSRNCRARELLRARTARKRSPRSVSFVRCCFNAAVH